MLKLKLTNINHTGANAIIIEDVVKNIKQDENLTTNLESSSLLWKVTVPHDSPYIKDIVNEEDWEALLYDEDSNHVITPFFTGYLSDSISWSIDQHGQNSVQLTLEDKGVHLLKAPFTKDQSKVISGKFSYEDDSTQDYGVVQQICTKAGITCVSNIITDQTEVKCVADSAETCESLLKAVCKEFCYAYSFNSLGQLYLIPLSTNNISAVDTVDDTEIYDSINLSKKTVTYKGSRVEWTDLGFVEDTLVYRDISNQSTTHPDCYITLNNGDTYPSPDGAISYIKAVDLSRGADVFSIDNLNPTIHWYDGNGTSQIQQYGANSIAVLITATSDGHIDKLQATADLTYVKSKNVVYGDGQLATEALREETCRWIHSETPAKKYANFLAQYDRYCSRSFTFKTKGTYELGDIIHLHENVHTGLDTYLMITRRARTLVEYDETNKTFSGLWSYEAVSTSQFDYSKPTTTDNLWIPPSTSYVEIPDVPESEGFSLTTDKSFLVKDLRSPSTQTIHIYGNIIGGLTGITVSASYSDGTSVPSADIHVVTPDAEWYIDNIPENTDASSLNITGTSGSITYKISVSFNDSTIYYKYLGEYTSDNNCIASGQVILIGDFYLNNSTGAAQGLTRECYAFHSTTGEPLFQNMPLTDATNAEKFLTSLYSATRNNVDLTAVSNPNTVSWFNTIVASKAVIDNLFSRYITILNGGSIHSDSYSDVGVKVNTNPGFWLGSNGQFLCDSGQMTNLSITGNSVFGGDFDCDVIKTADGSVSVRGTAQATDISKYQSRQLATAIRSLSLGGGLQPARIQNASGSYQQAVAYVSFLIDEGSHNTEYKVSFFDSAGSSINVTNMFSCTTNRESGPSIHYQKGDYSSSPEYYTYSNVSFTIEFIQGANRTLQLTLPSGSSGLASGMIYRDSSGYVRIV